MQRRIYALRESSRATLSSPPAPIAASLVGCGTQALAGLSHVLCGAQSTSDEPSQSSPGGDLMQGSTSHEDAGPAHSVRPVLQAIVGVASDTQRNPILLPKMPGNAGMARLVPRSLRVSYRVDGRATNRALHNAYLRVIPRALHCARRGALGRARACADSHVLGHADAARLSARVPVPNATRFGGLAAAPVIRAVARVRVRAGARLQVRPCIGASQRVRARVICRLSMGVLARVIRRALVGGWPRVLMGDCTAVYVALTTAPNSALICAPCGAR